MQRKSANFICDKQRQVTKTTCRWKVQRQERKRQAKIDLFDNNIKEWTRINYAGAKRKATNREDWAPKYFSFSIV